MLLCACSARPEDKNEKENKAEKDEDIQIGLAFDSFLIERWQRDRDIFVSRARDLGASVNVQNANGDLEKQKAQLKYLIDKEMDVIVLIAVDRTGLKKEVQEASRVPVSRLSPMIVLNGYPLIFHIL